MLGVDRMQMKMVHCINAGAYCDQGNKQATQFVDGFQAAQQLKSKHPDQFRLLSTVKLDFFSVGHDAIMMSRHPTIKCVRCSHSRSVKYICHMPTLSTSGEKSHRHYCVTLSVLTLSTRRVAVYLETHRNIGSKRAFTTGKLDR